MTATTTNTRTGASSTRACARAPWGCSPAWSSGWPQRAPAYSLAATLGLVIAGVGLQAPIVVVIAFVPMLFIALAYKELNEADPDCGTTFTWTTRAFGPWAGWAGGSRSPRRCSGCCSPSRP